MEYVAKNVESPRGLSQEEALRELQEHPAFKVGSVLTSIRQRGDKWFIRVLEPKVAAGFPFGDDEESDDDEKPELDAKPEGDSGDSEGDSEDSESSDDEDSDSPFPPKPEGAGDEEGLEPKDEGAQLAELTALVHKIVDALGIGGPDGLGPEGPPVPGEHGPPPGAGAPPGGPPGGAPGHGGARPGAGRPPGPGGGGARPLRDVPPGASPISGFASVQEMAKQIPSFTASSDAGLTIKEAKADLEDVYGPAYKVKQIKDAGGGKLSALLSVR
jgi:hypothetical protein